VLKIKTKINFVIKKTDSETKYIFETQVSLASSVPNETWLPFYAAALWLEDCPLSPTPRSYGNHHASTVEQRRGGLQ